MTFAIGSLSVAGLQCAFVREEPSFPIESAAVAREMVVRAYHSMARNDERDGIHAVRQSHGTAGQWLADSRSDCLIHLRRANGNLP